MILIPAVETLALGSCAQEEADPDRPLSANKLVDCKTTMTDTAAAPGAPVSRRTVAK
jgi:hypothetical protein